MACVLCACGGNSDTPAPPAIDQTPPVEDVTPTEEVQPSDFSEPIEVQEPVGPKPKKLEGLVFVDVTFSLYHKQCDFYCFNLESKEKTLITQISISSDGREGDVFEYNHMDLNQYSDDCSKIAVTKTFVGNGEKHAGWFDTNGNFFDVTEALGLQTKGDFDDITKHSSIGFSDGFFGYKSAKDGKEYYVPIDDVIPSAIQEGNVYTVTDRRPDDTNISTITSWIDDTHFLYNTENKMNGTHNIYIRDITTGIANKVVPGDSRDNWNGIISPDGTQIAFMSFPRGGTAAGDIYIIPVDGGDPVKVTGFDGEIADLGITFVSSTNWHQGYILIGWI